MLYGKKVLDLLYNIVMKYQNRVRLGQNKISHLFLRGSDLAEREKEILKSASKRLDFVPDQLLDRSNWWTSKEIGAFRYIGQFEGKKAVLKIQGVRPATSEVYMIQAFSKTNKSKILRTPLLYSYLPWDNKKRYEALVLEFIDGKPIVNNPTSESELKEFFALREECRRNCAVSPWIEKPKESLSEEIKNNFDKWGQASFKLYPTHPFRKKEDAGLIDEAVNILSKNYKNVEREFQHGHFGVSDLLRNKNGEVIILSNLYWSWKPPFYDAVFGYHWFIYNLSKLKNASPKLVEDQRNLWLKQISRLHLKGAKLKLLNLAFLERAAAGLNLDALSINQKSPTAEYLIQTTRDVLGKLILIV